VYDAGCCKARSLDEQAKSKRTLEGRDAMLRADGRRPGNNQAPQDNGFAQHVVCQYISNRRGSHISGSTLKRAFARELEIGKVELETIILAQFMAAIKRGEG
jgi:hypothetical protein